MKNVPYHKIKYVIINIKSYESMKKNRLKLKSINLLIILNIFYLINFNI